MPECRPSISRPALKWRIVSHRIVPGGGGTLASPWQQRDGRITAYPVVLRLEPRNQAVRIGLKLERRLRPSVLARHLKAIQQRPAKFNARLFLDRLLRAYTVLAPDWRAGEGPLVALAVLHDLLTLLPAAAADYPTEEFLVDLLRLDREPDARSTRGHRFELRGSTGTKGAKRLTVFDETGAPHDYYAVRFVTEAAKAQDTQNA